jgi:hypothetical protein
MKSQTAEQIRLGLGDSTFAALKQLGSFLAHSIESLDLQKTFRTELHRRVQELLDAEELAGLREDLEIADLHIISSEIISARIFSETIVYDWCMDAVDTNVEWSIINDVTHRGTLIEGVNADRVIHINGSIGVDLVNNQSALVVHSVNCLRKLEPEDAGSDADDELHPSSIIPFRRMAEHHTLPLRIKVTKDYGNIPAGTTMTLDTEHMIYRDEDTGKWGVPADFVLHISEKSLPSSPLGKTFSVEEFSLGVPNMDDDYDEDEDEFTEAELLGGFLTSEQAGDPDDDEGDDLLDQILGNNK